MNFCYQTLRLHINEIVSSNQNADVLVSVMEILTPRVVENLPPYFQNVNSIASTQEWLKQIVSDGRLFIVKTTGENTTIGFVFLSTVNRGDAHLGYLLGEVNWNKGYATEILKGLIDFIESERKVTRLIAGVSTDNVASTKLLHKLGFIHCSNEDNDTIFFEYRL